MTLPLHSLPRHISPISLRPPCSPDFDFCKNIHPFACFLDSHRSFRIKCPTTRCYLHPILMSPRSPCISFMFLLHAHILLHESLPSEFASPSESEDGVQPGITGSDADHETAVRVTCEIGLETLRLILRWASPPNGANTSNA